MTLTAFIFSLILLIGCSASSTIKIYPEKIKKEVPSLLFSVAQGGDLLISSYNTSILERLKKLQIKALRFDHILDYYCKVRIEGEKIYIDFRKLDKALDILSSFNITPVLCISYLPEGLLPPRKYSPVWRKIGFMVAEHTIKKGVKYFEIWNEPSNRAFVYIPFVSSYLPLYESLTLGIMDAAKKLDEKVFIGGCAQGNDRMGYEGKYAFDKDKVLSGENEGAEGFLGGLVDNLHHLCNFCKEKGLPLDFYSYHLYGKTPSEHKKVASIARKILSLYGFTNTKLFITEWNLGEGGFEGDKLLYTDFALSYTAETLATFLDAEIDGAFFFELSGWSLSPTWWAMIKRDGSIAPSYKVFCAFSHFKGNILEVDGENAIAAKDGEDICIILWNHKDKGRTVNVCLEDVEWRGFIESLKENKIEKIEKNRFSVSLLPFSVYLIRGKIR